MLEDETETTQEAPDDIRSTILAAMDEPVEAVTEATTEAVKSDRARSPDGKFAKAEEAPEAPVVEKPVEAVTEEAKAPVAVSATEAPANWSAEDKAKFKTLPQDGQEFLLRRHSAMEADYTRKTQDIAAFRNEYAPVKQMFDPHKEDLARAGYTPATLVQAWYNVERELTAGRGVGIVKSLVEGYKLDRQEVAKALGLVAPSAAPGVTAPPAPEGTTAALPPELQARLSQYDQFIAQQQRQQQEQQAATQREAQNRVMSTIDQFRGAKDASGNLAHPHFEEVEDHMTRLIIAARTSGSPVPPLDEIYEQAVWANPSTRARALEATRAAGQAQHAAAEAERTKEARAKAERARRAGSSVTGSPGTGQSAAQAPRGNESIRAALLAAADEHEVA